MALRRELAAGTMRRLYGVTVGDAAVDVLQGQDAVWGRVMRPGGGFACRMAYAPGGSLCVDIREASERGAKFQVSTAAGEFAVRLSIPDPSRPLLRWTVTLTPAADLRLPFWPRDLYPLDADGDPLATEGAIHAAQRGLNTGLVFLSLARPRFGTALYVQNLTALNDYFEATGTTPDGRVGGEWPDLGYQPPTSETRALQAGRPVTLSDAVLAWDPEIPADTRRAARLFLDLLAAAYPHLDRPESLYHDWPRRAQKTARDLDCAPTATVSHYGSRFVRPYNDAEYPDSMVQLTVLLPLREYADWAGKKIGLADDLRAGVRRFFDPDLGTLRRYLPNVGDDKNADEVDSWYLYHPLANVGRLALAGDIDARETFFQAIEYGIKVARHFHYDWPVQFNVRTLEVITGDRKPGEPGQSDAGGLYGYVMLQAHALTGEERYVKEAEKAVRATADRGFALEYQANITAWGALTCLRLWKLRGEAFYRDQADVFLANFFHNSLVWESQIGTARRYPIFMGVTCLHDGAYMALYECFEAFAAFHEALAVAGPEGLRDSVQLLLTEYCKYTPSRAWFYYPDALPKDVLATEVRNGSIDRRLSFPVEDLYADGQPAGQVGQEIYGCGAAFAFTTRSYHRLKAAPFVLFCEYPIYALDAPDEPCLSFRVRGVAGFSCRARLIPRGRKPLPAVTVRAGLGPLQSVSVCRTDEGHWEFDVPGDGAVEIRWQD